MEKRIIRFNLITFLTALCIILLSLVVMPMKANAAGYTIKTNKKEYNYNETIKVTYTGATNSKDWVGIYKRNTEPGKGTANAALAFMYINGSSNTFSFSPSTFIDSSYSKYSPQKGAPLEPGEYKAIIAKKDTYDVAAEYNFDVIGGTPKCSFDVISDSHVVASDDIRYSNLAYTLKDIGNYSTNSSAVIFNGDTVDKYDWYGYKRLSEICKENAKDLPFMFFNVGNHEFFDNPSTNDFTSTPYSYKLNRFLYFADNANRESGKGNSEYINLYGDRDHKTKPYYTAKVKGCTFVFVGNESLRDKDRADISDEQIRWLDEDILYKTCKYQEHQPIFVFGHQGLRNTVAGTHDGQGWDGVIQDGNLRFVLNKYPSTFYISGHSHWDLNAYSGPNRNIMYQDKATYGNGVGTTMFTDGGVTSSWTGGSSYQGATGLHFDVYEDKVIVKARDFLANKWINGARYVIDLNAKYKNQDQLMKNQ